MQKMRAILDVIFLLSLLLPAGAVAQPQEHTPQNTDASQSALHSGPPASPSQPSTLLALRGVIVSTESLLGSKVRNLQGEKVGTVQHLIMNPRTGLVRLLRYVVSEDCGTIINPTVVEGQIAGGVVQGLGGALLEHLVYDGDGNPLTTTFLDYLLPSATEIPMFEYGHIETPSARPGGFKGMGEGGAIGAPAAVFNAVADALAPSGVTLTHQPLTPDAILDALAGTR